MSKPRDEHCRGLDFVPQLWWKAFEIPFSQLPRQGYIRLPTPSFAMRDAGTTIMSQRRGWPPRRKDAQDAK